MLSPVLPRLIMEHGPLMSSNVASTVLLFALVYSVALIGVLPKWPRMTWLVPLLWFALAWTRVRHGPLFAVTAAIALGDMLPHIRWLSWLSSHGSHTCRLRPTTAPDGPIASRLRPALLPCALVFLTLGVQVCGLSWPLLGSGRARPNSNDIPMALLPELQEAARAGPPGQPIFNDMFFAGFLIYYTPELRVFIDDRCELYGDQGLLDYAHAYFEDPAQIDRWQEQYGFDLALVANGSGFDRYLETAPGWEVVGQTGPATLYRRRD